MSRLSIAAGIVFAGLICGPTSAQDPSEVVELYGNGVHAYYARQDFKAHELLTQVISSGTKDPRAYYFRAMTLMRMGREAAALADMEVGAMLEAQDANDAYPVARSLERVQGHSRRTLEKYRRQARFGALEQRRSIQRLKYEDTRRREVGVLRKQVQFSIEDVTSSDGAVPREPALLPASAAAPGATPEVSVAEEAGELFQPAAPEGVATNDASSTLEEMTDPFGEAPADAEEETPPTESTEADLLGESETPADDPEAPAVEPEAPVAEESTAAEPAATADDNASIDVGEKVKGRKLVGILGSVLGKVIGDNIPKKLPGVSMRPGPMGSRMGPNTRPGSRADGGSFGPTPGNAPLDQKPEGENTDDPFGDDSGDVPGSMPEDADDPFGDDAPDVMKEDNGPADGGSSDPFGETNDNPAPADDGVSDNPFDF